MHLCTHGYLIFDVDFCNWISFAVNTLFDYHFDSKKKSWIPWQRMVLPYIHNPEMRFNNIQVPTVESTRMGWLLQHLMAQRQPALLVGDTGTSKTTMVQSFLQGQDPDCTMQLSVTFSSRTTSMDVQRNLEASVEKRIKSVYGPPLGKILFVFLDDLNMPQVDNYGTQQPIALLKLLLEGGFMYNRGGKPGRKDLHDLHFLAAMGTTGGARHKVDSRFLSLFSIIHVPFPCAESLLSIYTSMLSGHLEPFSEDIQAMCKHITLCTAKLYNFVLQTLPPTPSRFHYIFNMRDLSRVYQGLCLTTHDRYRTKAKMVRVWRNECVRVFHDRLVNETDQALVQDHLLSLLIEHFPEEVEEARQEPLLFGDYWAALNIEETRTYEDLQDYENVRHFFQELLEAYNKSQKTPMNLVLFDYALEHLTRIHRLLRMHWGHAMLVGPPGCGHRSLTRLAAFTAGCQVFELPLSRGYCERVFREDLKKLYLQLGVDNKPTVFLINDSFIIEEGFLEHVNNMLTTGNVPALFSEEELEIALNELREEAGDAGVGVRKKEVWQFFMRRCRDNLHVVFTTSPAGDLLRLRCRSFPGLVNNTGIDWFLPWPHEALLQVAQSFLGDSGMVQEDLMPEVVQHAAMVYHCVEQNSLLFEQQLHRFNHVTPQNYLDCLNTYLHLLQEKNQLIQGQCTRLEGGLRKLQEASEELNELSEKLDEQKHELAEKAKACRTLLEEIAINKETVDAKTALARRKAQEMEEQNGVIAMEKHAAEKALSVALPALVTARLALQNFEKSDVTEIRSFAKPPRQVQMICESIMVIRGYREVNWKAAKAMMAEPNFLRLLVDMDCDSITQNQVKVVKGVLDKLGTTAKDMASISKAGAGMLRFVEAVVAYCDLSKEIKPKRDKMAWLEREYKRSGQQLESIQITVDMLQTEQDRMGDRYEIALKEEVRLKEETQLMETRLDAAEKLFSGLSSENARWHKELEEQCTRQRLLVGNCLLTAAFIAYQGPFTWEFRSKMSREWENDAESRRIPFSQPFQPETLLSDNVETARFGIKFLTSAIFEDGWRLLFSPLSVCLFVCLC
uniref:Dynein heavy chain n=1 Tax=Eptatretus burgeri TaxID=7764 RepID=A0A8C4NK34_EPTBU